MTRLILILALLTTPFAAPLASAAGACVPLVNVCVTAEPFVAGVDVYVNPGGDIVPQDVRAGCDPQAAPWAIACSVADNNNTLVSLGLPP